MKDRLIVLAQSLEQPRIVKRISQKAKKYKSVHVYGFTRNVHTVQNHEILLQKENVVVTVVGQLKNEKYFQRAFTFLKVLVRLYRRYGLGKKNVYVFGLDLRILSFFLINTNVCYEISDVIWLYASKTKRKVLGRLDTFLASKSHKVVFTTKSFYDSYYKEFVPENRVIIAENKLETYGRVHPIQQMQSDRVRIAYIGAFRYIGIIENLIKVVSNNENLILNFYGASHGGSLMETIDRATHNYPNIFYHGSFKNPDDLERIYGENNINFVVYDNTLENEKVAMPNKFYESGFFNIPIVCATKTYVGQRVLEQGLGWTIDPDFNSISNFLNNISLAELNECHGNIKNLDKGHFIT